MGSRLVPGISMRVSAGERREVASSSGAENVLSGGAGIGLVDSIGGDKEIKFIFFF